MDEFEVGDHRYVRRAACERTRALAVKSGIQDDRYAPLFRSRDCDLSHQLPSLFGSFAITHPINPSSTDHVPLLIRLVERPLRRSDPGSLRSSHGRLWTVDFGSCDDWSEGSAGARNAGEWNTHLLATATRYRRSGTVSVSESPHREKPRSAPSDLESSPGAGPALRSCTVHQLLILSSAQEVTHKKSLRTKKDISFPFLIPHPTLTAPFRRTC